MEPYAKKIPKQDKINRKMERFYSALGQFNTNMITWMQADEGNVDKATDFLVVQCPDHAEQCNLLGTTYMWDERNHNCQRKPAESELPEGGGSS
jgi:hypothetical protein